MVNKLFIRFLTSPATASRLPPLPFPPHHPAHKNILCTHKFFLCVSKFVLSLHNGVLCVHKSILYAGKFYLRVHKLFLCIHKLFLYARKFVLYVHKLFLCMYKSPVLWPADAISRKGGGDAGHFTTQFYVQLLPHVSACKAMYVFLKFFRFMYAHVYPGISILKNHIIFLQYGS